MSVARLFFDVEGLVRGDRLRGLGGDESGCEARGRYVGLLRREVGGYLRLHGFRDVAVRLSRGGVDCFYERGNEWVVVCSSLVEDASAVSFGVEGGREVVLEVLRHWVDDHRVREGEGLVCWEGER